MTDLKRDARGRILVLELVGTGGVSTLDTSLQQQLAAAWRDLDDDDGLRVAVLTGAFAGATDGTPGSPAPAWDLDALPLHTAKPVIAAVEGACYGLDFELALACDLRVAAAGSSFGFPDLDAAGPYRVASVLLPRITFAGLSLELLMSARTLDAREAYDARLVNRVAEPDQALEVAVELAEAMANRIGGDFRKQPILRMSGIPLATAMSMARQ